MTHPPATKEKPEKAIQGTEKKMDSCGCNFTLKLKQGRFLWRFVCVCVGINVYPSSFGSLDNTLGAHSLQ